MLVLLWWTAGASLALQERTRVLRVHILPATHARLGNIRDLQGKYHAANVLWVPTRMSKAPSRVIYAL
jgi:hypothetical protein